MKKVPGDESGRLSLPRVLHEDASASAGESREIGNSLTWYFSCLKGQKPRADMCKRKERNGWAMQDVQIISKSNLAQCCFDPEDARSTHLPHSLTTHGLNSSHVAVL